MHSFPFVPLLVGSWLISACASNAASPTSAPTASAAPTPNPVAQGRQLFLRVCAECHGEEGEGYANDLAAPALDDSEHAWHHPDQQICDWIINGKLGLGHQMPAYGDRLSDAEVEAVIAYLHTLWTPEQLESQQDVTSRYQEP